jgi:O-acetyl-ADP-ribose deacetylase (regulator of RNase III)
MIGTYEIVLGDATRPRGDGFRIIAHVVNDCGRWGSGFVVAVSKRWDSPEKMYRLWHRGGTFGVPFELGNVQFIPVGYNYQDLSERGIIIANMLAQNGLKSPDSPKPVCYRSLRKCLSCVWETAKSKDASVHIPYKMGCDRGGGDWSEVETIIQEELVRKGISVTVYKIGQ